MRLKICFIVVLTVLLNVLFTGCNGGHRPMHPDECLRCTFTKTPVIYLTPTFTVTFTITPTNTPTYTPDVMESDLLDNMDDGDNINNWGGFWYTYNDYVFGGDSYVVPLVDTPFYMQRPDISYKGYAARITGYVTTTFMYSYIGMGTMLNSLKNPVDLNKYSKIKFWCKGDGAKYRIMLASVYPDFMYFVGNNHYGYDFIAPANWTQYEIYLTQFTQEPYWGNIVERTLALSKVTDIWFQTTSVPAAPRDVDLWIDEIIFEK
ncbi:MAG: CIA30 family protein [Candidatus Goldbacteria bacterium]|nr:CIA30 family protein [Candidatus Goldiibacteriota bacterium]